jgi:hypothetical protein
MVVPPDRVRGRERVMERFCKSSILACVHDTNVSQRIPRIQRMRQPSAGSIQISSPTKVRMGEPGLANQFPSMNTYRNFLSICELYSSDLHKTAVCALSELSQNSRLELPDTPDDIHERAFFVAHLRGTEETSHNPADSIGTQLRRRGARVRPE